MDENGEKTVCEERCDANLKGESNSAENHDDEPPLKCPKQGEEHEQTSSGPVFFIDNTCDKEAYMRFLSADSTTDEDSPHYTTDFIQLDEPEPEEPASVDTQPSVVCFNCGGKHFLNECTKEINTARVSQKRKEMARERDAAPKKLRYFEHEMLSQRFQPGKYSEELRKALDLCPEDLPPFIYRMRVLGYPPGWLTYAEVEKSGITIYGLDDNDKSKENKKAGELEPGEVDVEEEVEYDPNRLVDFPGFNVPVPPGVHDLCEKYGMPPMLPHQQRSEAEKYMKAPVVKSFHQRQKLPPPVIQQSTDIGQVVDMHIDDGAEDEVVCFESGSISAVTAADSSTDSRCTSTDVSQECPVPEPQSAASDCKIVASSSGTEADEQEQPSPVAAQNCSTSSSNSSTVDTPKSKTHKVTLGTPMLLGFSKYTSLPPRENFAKGMTDYIPFENLPGTTGRYDKLRAVLQKVRALRQEDEKSEDS